MDEPLAARGLVVLQTGGFVDVDLGDRVVRCRLRGRLKKDRARTDLCVVGDEVEIVVAPDGTGSVEAVKERRTRFSRTHPARGGGHVEDVLVANLDQLVVCFAFGTPPFHPRMLDRFLVIAEQNDVRALIVANKCDREEAKEQRALFQVYPALGYEVLETSAVTGVGLDLLAARLEGKISAFAGPSGTGKSSLVNRLVPGLGLRVGGTSESSQKGTHTTRVATLHPLPQGGFVADTPGIRELATFALSSDDLDACFPELRARRGTCAFRNCRHLEEPGCEVKAAVSRGEILPARYDSYVRMLTGAERKERVG